MNKATHKMNYRLLRLSFGLGKSANFHCIAPSLLDINHINKLAKNRFGMELAQ